MKLIINADDFGLSKSITDGIVDGICGGYLTSTTIMANMPYAKYAVYEAVKHNIKCIGLHINLTVGKPIINNKNLTDENGIFLYNKNQINNPKLTYEDAYNEIKAQIAKVEEYSNGKLMIDHFDTHHHLLDNLNISKAIADICKEYNLPIRKDNLKGVKAPDVLEHSFTIDNVSISALKNIIQKYKATDSMVEIMSHPGYIDDYTKSVTSYLDRDKELTILKEAKDNGVFDGVELISFADL